MLVGQPGTVFKPLTHLFDVDVEVDVLADQIGRTTPVPVACDPSHFFGRSRVCAGWLVGALARARTLRCEVGVSGGRVSGSVRVLGWWVRVRTVVPVGNCRPG
jgi:hypothetical protein